MAPKKAQSVGLGKPACVIKGFIKNKTATAAPKKKPLGKGKKKPVDGGKKKPLGKGKNNQHKTKLNRTNLKKLGKMSLDEKIKQATEEAESTEDQAIALKSMLSKDEHSKVWGKYKTHLDKHPLEKGEVDALPKKEKGLKAAQWLMEREGTKYVHMKQSVGAKQTIHKGEVWESQKAMVDRFGEDELEAHMWSGRVTYRQDPHTPGVWQYQDTQNWSSSFEVQRGKKWEQGTEREPDQEDLEKFSGLHGQSWKTLGMDDLASDSKGKGFGKGSGKGSGKGKGKGKNNQLAIEDGKEEEAPEEDELKTALKKARKARDSAASSLSDLEDALEKAAPKLTRQGKAAAEGWKLQLNKTLTELKSILSGKKAKTASEVKKALEESAKVVQGSKSETKELKAFGNKAASVASTKRSKGSKR